MLHHRLDGGGLRVGLFTVGRVCDEKSGRHAFFGTGFAGVALTEGKASVVEHVAEARAAGVFLGLLDDEGRDVAACNADPDVPIDGGARIFLHFSPEVDVKALELFEGEAAIEARRHACSHLRSFDSDRARAAERIDECLGGIPAREHQKTCRKVFLQGSLAVGETPAALEERFARKIQIEGAGVVGEEGGDAHVGVVSLDVGTTSREVAEAVADAVLDAEHGEVDRFERAALAVGRDLDRQVGTEPLLPRGVCSHFINVAGVPVGGLGDLHEHAAGEAGVEAYGHRRGGGAGKGDAATRSADAFGAAGGDFASKQFFKPEGADGVKGKVGHGLSVGVCSERGGQRRPSPWPSTTYLSEVRPSRPTGPRT